MGSALLGRWLACGLPAERVTVIDPAPRRDALPEAVRCYVSPAAIPVDDDRPDLLVLGIKPQTLPEASAALVAALGARGASPLLVSMLAGVRVATLSHLFPGCPVARLMPNLAVRVGKGATALHAPGLGERERATLEALLAPTGLVVSLDDETRFDAVTALSGSGPAFLFRFVEALAGAGEAAGLPHETAVALAQQTVIGAAALAELSGLSPTDLRQQVTSPHGTTEAGLDVLDGDGALSALLRATIRAAAERSRALAAAAEAAVDSASPRPAAAA